jgi:hypothetical protein
VPTILQTLELGGSVMPALRCVFQISFRSRPLEHYRFSKTGDFCIDFNNGLKFSGPALSLLRRKRKPVQRGSYPMAPTCARRDHLNAISQTTLDVARAIGMPTVQPG